jgi:predicted SAM-dependent methyltransferase
MIQNLLKKLGLAPAPQQPALQLLNLGCGGHFHPDWINVDIVPQDPRVMQHDLQARLPFEDASFAAVYHSHVLEHIPKRQAAAFLSECHRVLAPGGVLRVVVPDLEMITRLYLKYLDEAVAGDEQAAKRHEWMTLELLDQLAREESGGEMLKYWQQNPMPAEDYVIERMGREVLNYLTPYRASFSNNSPEAPAPEMPQADPEQIGRFRLGGEVHKWMYDRRSLRVLLEQCGFQGFKVCKAEESSIRDFISYGLDLHGDGSIRKPDSLFVEAIRH